jgi:hypothetical protein
VVGGGLRSLLIFVAERRDRGYQNSARLTD